MSRFALIGCGDVVADYVAAIARVRGASISATVDSDGIRARDAAEKLGASGTAPSLDELLATQSAAFDAVLIHTSDESHSLLAEKAARAGKHVLVETPMALSITAADAVLAACQTAGVRLMVRQDLRFMPAQRVAKESLVSGRLGDLGLLRIHHWEPLAAPNDQPCRIAGEGRLMRRLIAHADLAIWFFGSLPSHVQCLGRPRHMGVRDVSYVQIHLGFPQGAMALLDYSTAVPYGTGYFSLSLIGAKGAAYVDDHHDSHLMFRGGKPTALTAEHGISHVVLQLQEFADAIEQHRAAAVTGEDARAAVEVAEAVMSSLASGQVAHRKGESYELV